MVDMDVWKWAELIITGIFLLLFMAFTITIKRNNENIFFSMRSSNLMIITNALIFFSFIAFVIDDIFYEKMSGILKYFSTFYFIFQLSIFCALIMRYFRLYISCLNPEDNNVQFNLFTPKSYHYEYFYVRILAIVILLTLVFTTFGLFLARNKNIMICYEILLKDDKVDSYYFWMIFSFIETIVFLTLFLLIEKTNLNPNVHISLEIFLVSLINYIYSLSIALSFYNGKNGINLNENIIKLIPIIYNILIYFVVIALPFLYGVFNTTVIIYDLPGELCSSLYLLKKKKKCFDAFYHFLASGYDPDRDKYTLFLNLLISIFKYRLLVNNRESNELIIEEINNIRNKYLQKIINLNLFDNDKEKDKVLDKETVESTIDSCRRENLMPFKVNLFDKVASAIYQILDKKFYIFQRDDKFNDLKNELEMETNIRCKLANFGLIRN